MYDIVDKHWPMSQGDGKATRKKRPRILAITDKQLARKRGDAKRGPFLVYRAYAQEAKRDFAAALTTLDEAKPAEPGLQLLAAALRVLALVETGDVAAARRVVTVELLDADRHYFRVPE